MAITTRAIVGALIGGIIGFFLYRGSINVLMVGITIGAFEGLLLGHFVSQGRKLVVIIGILVFAHFMAFGLDRQEYGEVKLNSTLL